MIHQNRILSSKWCPVPPPFVKIGPGTPAITNTHFHPPLDITSNIAILVSRRTNRIISALWMSICNHRKKNQEELESLSGVPPSCSAKSLLCKVTEFAEKVEQLGQGSLRVLLFHFVVSLSTISRLTSLSGNEESVLIVGRQILFLPLCYQRQTTQGLVINWRQYLAIQRRDIR